MSCMQLLIDEATFYIEFGLEWLFRCSTHNYQLATLNKS